MSDIARPRPNGSLRRVESLRRPPLSASREISLFRMFLRARANVYLSWSWPKRVKLWIPEVVIPWVFAWRVARS